MKGVRIIFFVARRMFNLKAIDVLLSHLMVFHYLGAFEISIYISRLTYTYLDSIAIGACPNKIPTSPQRIGLIIVEDFMMCSNDELIICFQATVIRTCMMHFKFNYIIMFVLFP